MCVDNSMEAGIQFPAELRKVSDTLGREREGRTVFCRDPQVFLLKTIRITNGCLTRGYLPASFIFQTLLDITHSGPAPHL